MRRPMRPNPMIPRVKPLGLRDTGAKFLLASMNLSLSPERAAVLDQLRFRKTEMMSQIAASATDSVQAAAALQYVTPKQYHQ